MERKGQGYKCKNMNETIMEKESTKVWIIQKYESG